MANISLFSRLVNGVQRQVDLSTNTIVVQAIQINGTLLSATGGSGLVGDAGGYSNFTPTGATVRGALQGIDTALASSGGTQLDGTFKIENTSDPTKIMMFDASGIATGTTRTLKMSNFNTDLAHLLNANIDAAAAIALTKLAALASHNRALVSDASGFIAESAVTATELGYVSGVTSAIQTQINNLTSTIQNFEWQPSVLSATILTPPGSPSTGDRYLINGTGAGGWSGHDNQIAQWSGSAWIYTTATVGMFVASDAEPNLLYLFGGSTWSQKAFESTTASTGLTKVGFDIQLANATGTGITVTSGALAVLFDNSTIGLTTNQLFVKNGGITEVQINSSALSASGALSGGSGTKLAWVPDNSSLEISSNAGRIKTTAYDQATITGGGGSAAAVAYAPNLKESLVAGETFAATTLFAVRFAKAADAGFVAGRVYKADNDATTVDNFWAIGLVYNAGSTSAGSSMLVHKHGLINVPSHGFTVGQPLWLSASGAVTGTAPSTANICALKLGMVRDANNIEVQIGSPNVY